MEVVLQGVDNFACRGVDLTVREGEILALLGPTGAGKSTLLNVIAGLVPYKGSVSIGGQPVDHLPPEKRGVGYLFQSIALFPHMTVRQNIAFGLRARGMKPSELRRRVEEVLELLRIAPLADRYPKALSGGEAQRVALARALAPGPRVLLLDEPLNKLDLRTAKYLRLEFRRLQRRLHITTIYVTHNQVEAFEMGDRIAVMDGGRIHQVGTPSEVLFSPSNDRVSEYFGSPNILECRRQEVLDSGLALVDLGGFSVVVPYRGRPIGKVAISPWNVYISREHPPGPELNRLRGRVRRLYRNPPVVKVEVEIGDQTLWVEVEEETWEEIDLTEGEEAYLILPLRWIKTLEVEDGV